MAKITLSKGDHSQLIFVLCFSLPTLTHIILMRHQFDVVQRVTITISCVYLFLTPNSRYLFLSWGVVKHSFIHSRPVLHDWCNKGHGMCNPVCGMVHIKEPLLLIGKNSVCSGSRFPLSLFEWSFTICLPPYNRK